jgi:hypothetical protein
MTIPKLLGLPISRNVAEAVVEALKETELLFRYQIHQFASDLIGKCLALRTSTSTTILLLHQLHPFALEVVAGICLLL